MGLLELAGFQARPRSRASGRRASPSRRRTRRWCWRTSMRRRRCTGSGSTSRSTAPAPATTPLTAGQRKRVRRLRGRDREGESRLPRRDRRQRAEPQPLLDAAVRARRQRRVGARVPAPARDDLRRAEGGGARGSRLGRRARAARRRQAEHRPRHDLPHALPPRARRRVPEERPGAAGHGRLLVPSLPAQLERPRRRAALGSGPSRADRPGRARATARQGASTAPARSAGGCRSSTTSSGSSRRSRRRSASCTAASSRRRRGRCRRRRRRRRTGARSSSPTASRTSPAMLLFHTHDEPGRPGWQSGLVYADGSPKTSLEPVRRAIESRARTHSARARSRRRCLPRSRPPNVRSRSDASALHLPGPARCACRAGRRWRRRPAAPPPGERLRVPARPAESTPGWYQALGLVPRRGAARTPRRARRHAVRGACLLAAALLAGCGGDDGPGRPASGWSGRRLRPARRACAPTAAGRRVRRRRDHELLAAGKQRRRPAEEVPSCGACRSAGGTRIFLAVYHPGARTTPLRREARSRIRRVRRRGAARTCPRSAT